MEANKVKQVIKSESDILTFGKFRGKSIRYVLDNEPSYILWLWEHNVSEISVRILVAASILSGLEDNTGYLQEDDIWSNGVDDWGSME